MGCPSAGGCGGKGGDIIVQCKEGASLAQFKTLGNRRQIALHGTHYKYEPFYLIHVSCSFLLLSSFIDLESERVLF